MRIAPAGDGQEQRTFECVTCKQQMHVMVKPDRVRYAP
jgi:hypothetical protein